MFMGKDNARHQATGTMKAHGSLGSRSEPTYSCRLEVVLDANDGSLGTHSLIRSRFRLRSPLALIVALALGSPLLADCPWETAVNNLQTSFTGPIAKGLLWFALVVGGLMFAYSESGSKKVFAGIVFGLGMALGAANFMAWLFP